MVGFTRILLLILLSHTLQFGIAQEQAGAENGQVFRVNVNLVQVDAQVLQKKTGRPVGSLGKEAFQLFEDGVPQKITEVSRDQLPLSVVLLFDLTFTVQPVLKPLAAGAMETLQHLKPEDEVAVMVYSSSAQLLQDFTTDRELIVAAIQKASEMTSGDQAFFNQAVFQAAEQLAKATIPRSRRTIIWLTDNVPNIPSAKQRNEKEAFQEVLETGATVFSMVERSGASDLFIASYSKNPLFALSRMRNPPGDVHKYAERTGGEVMNSSKNEVSAKLALMIDEIRTRYTIAYYPSVQKPKGQFCKIRVEVSVAAQKQEGQMQVRTKTGYYR